MDGLCDLVLMSQLPAACGMLRKMPHPWDAKCFNFFRARHKEGSQLQLPKRLLHNSKQQ